MSSESYTLVFSFFFFSSLFGLLNEGSRQRPRDFPHHNICGCLPYLLLPSVSSLDTTTAGYKYSLYLVQYKQNSNFHPFERNSNFSIRSFSCHHVFQSDAEFLPSIVDHNRASISPRCMPRLSCICSSSPAVPQRR